MECVVAVVFFFLLLSRYWIYIEIGFVNLQGLNSYGIGVSKVLGRMTNIATVMRAKK